MVEVRRDLYQRQIISRREVEIAEELLAETQRKIKETERLIREAKKDTEKGSSARPWRTSRWPSWCRCPRAATRRAPPSSASTGPSPSPFPMSRAWSASSTAASAAPFHQRARAEPDARSHRLRPPPGGGRGGASRQRRGPGPHAVSAGQNIPFVGVRQAVPGASTGAHIHIGQPSRRITDRR